MDDVTSVSLHYLGTAGGRAILPWMQPLQLYTSTPRVPKHLFATFRLSALIHVKVLFIEVILTFVNYRERTELGELIPR
jgi:hypothetical protein